MQSAEEIHAFRANSAWLLASCSKESCSTYADFLAISTELTSSEFLARNIAITVLRGLR